MQTFRKLTCGVMAMGFVFAGVGCGGIVRSIGAGAGRTAVNVAKPAVQMPVLRTVPITPILRPVENAALPGAARTAGRAGSSEGGESILSKIASEGAQQAIPAAFGSDDDSTRRNTNRMPNIPRYVPPVMPQPAPFPYQRP